MRSILCFFLLQAGHIQAQSDSLTFMRLFNKSGQLQWKLKGTVVHTGNTCTNGEYLTFLGAQRAVEKKCDISAKKWEQQQFRWRLVKNGKIWLLLLNEKPYYFTIGRNKGIPTLHITNKIIDREQKITRFFHLNENPR